ncbi:hypothetical protein ACLKA6_007331 [Drosophila palustris]
MAVSASINALGSKPSTASPAQQVLTDVRMAIAQFKENNPFVSINIEDDDSPMADVALTFRLISGMPLLFSPPSSMSINSLVVVADSSDDVISISGDSGSINSTLISSLDRPFTSRQFSLK